MIHITEEMLRAVIQICLGGDSIYTEGREAKLVHNIKALSIDDVSGHVPGYVKIEDECYIEDCFDNEDNPIDGRFTEIYLKIDEVKNGGKLKSNDR